MHSTCRGRRRGGRCLPRPCAEPSRPSRRRCGEWARRPLKFHCGVVSGAPPVCPAPELDVPRLVLLHDREGRRRQELVGRGVEEHVAAALLGSGTVLHGQSAGALSGPPLYPAAARRPTPPAAARDSSTGHILPVPAAHLVGVVWLVVTAVGAPRARTHLAHHVEAIGEVVGDAVHVGVVLKVFLAVLDEMTSCRTSRRARWLSCRSWARTTSKNSQAGSGRARRGRGLPRPRAARRRWVPHPVGVLPPAPAAAGMPWTGRV